jgi:hemerythrin-like metal-binding protein
MLVWHQKYMTNVRRIDADHLVLFSLINQVIINGEDGNRDMQEQVIDALLDYTSYHFRYEELLMSVNGYPHLEDHKAQHDALRLRLQTLAKDSALTSRQLRQVLVNWLVDHISQSDKELARWLHDNDGAVLDIERDVPDGETMGPPPSPPPPRPAARAPAAARGQQQESGLVQISAAVRDGCDLGELQDIARDMDDLGRRMVEQGISPYQITLVLTSLTDQLTKRIIELEFAAEQATGEGIEEISYCWLSFGSAGRREPTFASDQDNGIIFQAPHGRSADWARQRLLPFARRVNIALDTCGISLCKGNIMAGELACCQSFDEWKASFTAWMRTPSPEALLNSVIYFDFRPVYGDTAPAEALREWMAEAVRTNTRLHHLLTVNALERGPPLGLLRDFVTDADGCIDLKLSGMALFVDAARIMALASGVRECNTIDRLRLAADAEKVANDEAAAWIEGFLWLQTIRLRQQCRDKALGRPVSNRIAPAQLNGFDRKLLKEVLRQAGELQRRIKTRHMLKAAAM